MKAFVAWLAITVGLFGALGGVYHYYYEDNPRKVLVIIDSSLPMSAVWGQIPTVLVELEQQQYSQFALVTEKRAIHGWSEDLSLGNLKPFAPRNFSKLTDPDRYRELREQAEKVVFITTAEEAATEHFDEWTINRLTP